MNTIASKIIEKRVFENGRIFIAPTKAKNVVSFEGSVFGGTNFLPESLNKVPGFTASLLDAGTKNKDKATIQNSLAARAASLQFSSGTDRTFFSGSCLPEDLGFVLSLAAECLNDAIFPMKELTLLRERSLGRLKENKTNTNAQAREELSRMLFDPAHVNYEEKDSVTEKRINAVTRKDLLDFKKMLGRGGLVLAVVGDVTESSVLRAAEKAFGTLAQGILEAPSVAKNKKVPVAEEKRITIQEKANIDTIMGVAIPMNAEDKRFIPLFVISKLLGDGFTSHLMETVRERDGLTYHISAHLDGFAKDVEGSFYIWSIFSPLLYERGVATIRKELKNFFDKGITEDKLSWKKEDIIGTYAVGLSTTRGLARRLHQIGLIGKDLSFIDTYLDEIRAVTLADLHEAAALIPLNKLSLSAAGTFLK